MLLSLCDNANSKNYSEISIVIDSMAVRFLLMLLPHLFDNGPSLFPQGNPGPKPSHHFDKRECEE